MGKSYSMGNRFLTGAIGLAAAAGTQKILETTDAKKNDLSRIMVVAILLQQRYGLESVANPDATPPSSTPLNLVRNKNPAYLLSMTPPFESTIKVPYAPNSETLSFSPSTIPSLRRIAFC